MCEELQLLLILTNIYYCLFFVCLFVLCVAILVKICIFVCFVCLNFYFVLNMHVFNKIELTLPMGQFIRENFLGSQIELDCNWSAFLFSIMWILCLLYF